MVKKIVFINQAAGYLTIDIINEFAEEFDKIALITGSIRVQDKQLNEKVKISKIIRYNRGNNLKKGLSWLLGTVQIFFLLKFKYNRHERFFITIPPTAYLMACTQRSAFSVLVFDLYPDALKINGFSENGWLYKWWLKRNAKIFSRAHRVYTLSENMKLKILDYSADINIRVIPNWSAFSGYTPVNKENNKIIQREGYKGKFIVQYSGNIGVTHNVEILVYVAENLLSHKDLQFLIIGRGEKSEAISKLIKEKKLSNCIILPFRDDAELYESLCVPDLAVVTLDDKTPDISVPSKVYNILSAGVPIMGISSMKSGISGIIEEYNIGKNFEKDDIAGMTDFIIELKNNHSLKDKLSANSYLASKNFTNDNAGKYLESYKTV